MQLFDMLFSRKLDSNVTVLSYPDRTVVSFMDAGQVARVTVRGMSIADYYKHRMIAVEAVLRVYYNEGGHRAALDVAACCSIGTGCGIEKEVPAR